MTPIIITFLVLLFLCFVAAPVAVIISFVTAISNTPQPQVQIQQPPALVQQYQNQEQGQAQAEEQTQNSASNQQPVVPADTTTFTQSWMPELGHPLGSADPNGCPANSFEAVNLFGGAYDRWNQLDDPNKTGNEKWPGWSLAEARLSDTTPTFPYLYVPANMRADWWDNDVSHSTMGPGYIGPVSEATFWCWVEPGQIAPHPLWKALVSPPQ